MAIVFFGTPRFAVPSLRALMEAGEDIAAVVTRPDAARDRTKKPIPSHIKETALTYGLKVLEPRSMIDPAFIDELKRIDPEFLVVVAYGRILTREILSIPKIAPVNVHGSLLPKYRGASPINWAIINGERETGVTTMVITYELDSGDILLQEKTPISEEDTAESLGRRLSETGAKLLVKTLKGMREGTVKPRHQEGEPTFAPPLTKEFGHIDWQKSARELFNFVRGVYPWPGAYSFLNRERVKLIKAKPIEGEGRPGVIEKAEGDYLVVGTGEGLLSIIELQPEGKTVMPARAFMQGRDIKKGDRFE
jgi:methionyl-tRNA formyltransferase